MPKGMAIVKLPIHSIIKAMSLKGKPFSISSITYILSNPFYMGKIQFAKYKDWNENVVKD